MKTAMRSAEAATTVALLTGVEEGGGISTAADNGGGPRKSAIALTAFLACLSFLAFFVTAIVTFIQKLADDQEIWNNIYPLFNGTTACVNTSKGDK